jgi:gliding motility-associated-like protein
VITLKTNTTEKMKKLTNLLIFLFSLVTVFGNAQCPTNIGFEQTAPGTYIGAGNAYAVASWTLSGNYANTAGYNCANLGTPYNLGSNEFAIVSTPLTYNSNGGGCSFILGNSPFGGTRVARLNNNTSNYARNKIATTFNVTAANTLFQFAFAGYYENPGHNCCDQPGLYLRVLNACGGNTIASCSSMSLAANCGTVANVSFTNCGTLGVMSNWQVKAIDLTPYIGGCVTIEAWTADCNFGGHYGTTFFDAMCGGQLIGQGLGGIPGGPIPGPVSYCSGSGVATIAAPAGYSSYQWYGPNGIIPAPTGTLSVLTVTAPIPGQTYTVQLVSQGGCQLTAINTLNTSTVSIAGIGSSPTCPGGASGTATVQGNGSGAGYTYTWTNSTGSVVGTQSVAVGLPAGIYSVAIAGSGAALCGSASATVAVGTATPATQNLYKPFCNGQAYLSTIGGSNFQWYNNTTPIAAPLGIAASYTVTSPLNGAVYNLTYINTQNCLSNVSFTLMASAPGSMSAASSSVCLGLSNGTGTINLTPAAGAPPGVISFAVQNTSLAPAYTSTSGITSSTQYTFNGLAAGQYSISAFDGSCFYNSILNVNTHLFSPILTPSSVIICSGSAFAAGITFPTPVGIGQYTYSWTPNVFLFANNPTLQNTIITPTLAIGTQTNMTYSVVITPTVINCPVTRTMSMLATNPPTPTITAIPNLCTNGSNYQIIANPPGGVFSILSGIIVPTATNLAIGTNTVSYTINVNGCVAVTTATFQLNQFVPSTLTNSIAPLCVTSPTVNLMNIVQNLSGNWSGPGITSNILNPAATPGVFNIVYNTTSFPNPLACPSTTSLSISITNTVMPLISAPAPFCNNAATFILSASPSGGIWGGNPAVSSLGVVTPSLSSPTNTFVSYVVNTGPCVNTATITIYPSTFNTASLTGAVPALCVSSTPFNLMSIVTNTSGVWSGTSITSNLFNPAALPTGSYITTYSINSTPNATLCPDTRTISISVLNPPTPVITPISPLCSQGAAVQLTVTPSTGTWVSVPYITSGGVFNPSVAAIGNNLVQYVIGTPTCNVSHSIQIAVEQYVPSTIINQIPDLCNTGAPINLTPYTVSSSGIWTGPGISGTMFNPTISGSGTVVVSYNTASNPSGLCPSTSTMAVTVYSLATPVIATPNRVCNSFAPFQLIVTPVGGLFSGVNNAATGLSGIFHPGLGIIGNNIVSYSISAGPCLAITQNTVIVEKFISADLASYPRFTYCKGLETPFNLNSYVQNPGYVWTGVGVLASMFNPNVPPVGYATVNYQTYSSPTTWLCPDTMSFRVWIAPVPVITPVVSATSGCSPLQVIFNVTQTNGHAEWHFGDLTDSISGLAVSHTYSNAGNYTPHVTFVSAEGCPAVPVTLPSIIVFPTPVANFNYPKDIYISEPSIQLINTSTPLTFNTYTWNVSNGIGIFNSINTTFTVTDIGKYEVNLIAMSTEGCKSEMTKYIHVRNEYNIFVPNSFTPNFDGLNDIFLPVFSNYGISNKYYSLQIYDRWGSLIFHTHDIQKGWDGTFKGEPCNSSVYVYSVNFKDLDGRIYQKMGHVSLIK